MNTLLTGPNGLKIFKYKDIVSWDPCYAPSRYLKEEWEGTAIDILGFESIPFADRLWCVLRAELVSDRVMRLFAVWSYRQTLIHTPDQDLRSRSAADTAERFALGAATLGELESARSAARSAAGSAARSAEWSAAGSAARSAEWSAAWAARSARAAAWSARSGQKEKLIEMIIAEGKERLKNE